MLISFPDWLILSLAAIGWLFLVAITGMGGLLVFVILDKRRADAKKRHREAATLVAETELYLRQNRL